MLKKNITCPVCGFHLCADFFDAGNQTLVTLGWPKNTLMAKQMPKFAHNFVLCLRCQHIFNCRFDYQNIPYEKNPNKMFNGGKVWNKHLEQTRQEILKILPNENPCVIDIGCGDGGFLKAIADVYINRGGGTFIGFDPSNSPENGLIIEFYADYFQAEKHIKKYSPDVLLIRHVLEHLTNPAEFLQQIAFYISINNTNQQKYCYLFIEVPNIKNALNYFRLTDFFYEHYSHFSENSLQTLLEPLGKILYIKESYSGEILNAMLRFDLFLNYNDKNIKIKNNIQTNLQIAKNFYIKSQQSILTIQQELTELYNSKEKIAIWGGTGKAANFMHLFNVDDIRFPIVIDSDKNKCGDYVPGMGQIIQNKNILQQNPVDIIIIPTHIGIKNIYTEIQNDNIYYQQILIEHNGHLVNLENEENPYYETIKNF